MTPIRYAFEPFSTLKDVLSGNPIKIMPLGKFFRDDRELNITPDVLQEMAANFKDGLPRFRVPINENHAGIGKVGTVEDVAFLQDGADGPGLYATKYELTEAGQSLVKDGRFDAVSPEVVWSLNDGAQYQDPQTGQMHDNVLIGLALTDRPFFGHDNVALFSATQEVTPMTDTPMADTAGHTIDKSDQILAILHQLMGDETEMENDVTEPERFKTYDTATRREFAKKGWALPDGSYPIADKQDLTDAIHAVGRGRNNPHGTIRNHIMKRARALGATDLLPDTWKASDQIQQKEDVMADEVKETAATAQATPTPPATPPAAEGFSVTPDEFKALQDKAAQVEALRAQADEFKTQLSKVQYERDLDRMRAHADHFVALPIKVDELGKQLLDLKMANEDLFKYFDALLVQIDQTLTQADLFGQIGKQRAATTETFESVVDQVLAEKFAGDKSKYSEAMNLARERRPDLADAYLNRR